MKKQNDTAPEAKSNALMTEEHEKADAISSTGSKSENTLSADKQVMATHGFLRILSTIKRR